MAKKKMTARRPLPTVWLGVSVEDQKRADERIPLLLQTPAAVRFLSLEPLLGPISLPWNCNPIAQGDPSACQVSPSGCLCSNLHWVIVGGESGPGARPCNVEWIRSVVQQCKLAGVACFVKQLGSHPRMPWREYKQWHPTPPAVDCSDETLEPIRFRDRKGGDPAEWPEDLRVRQFPAEREAV